MIDAKAMLKRLQDSCSIEEREWPVEDTTNQIVRHKCKEISLSSVQLNELLTRLIDAENKVDAIKDMVGWIIRLI